MITHKVVWMDGAQAKSVKGELISEDEVFITIQGDGGVEFRIAKKQVITIKKYGDEQ